jgi:hypothetical protein
MRILLILILIAAGLIVWQANKHGCKYDATLLNCVLGKAEQPAAEMPAAAPEAAPEAPAPEAPAPAQ